MALLLKVCCYSCDQKVSIHPLETLKDQCFYQLRFSASRSLDGWLDFCAILEKMVISSEPPNLLLPPFLLATWQPYVHWPWDISSLARKCREHCNNPVFGFCQAATIMNFCRIIWTSLYAGKLTTVLTLGCSLCEVIVLQFGITGKFN